MKMGRKYLIVYFKIYKLSPKIKNIKKDIIEKILKII